MSALVYWIEDGTKSVIDSTIIPKKYREVGAVVELLRTREDNPPEYYSARILKLNESQPNFEQLRVPEDDGKIEESLGNKSHQTFITPGSKQKMAKETSTAHQYFRETKGREKCNDTDDRRYSKSDEIRRKKTAKTRKEVLDITTDITNEENSSDDISSEEDEATPAVKISIPAISAETMKTITLIYKMILDEHERQQKIDQAQTDDTKIPPSVRRPGRNKTEIFPGSLVFLPTGSFAYMVQQFQKSRNWREIAEAILMKIYGKNRKIMTKNENGGKTPVDPAVFNAIFDLVNSLQQTYISTDVYTKFVTEVCANRENKNSSSNKRKKKHPKRIEKFQDDEREIVGERDPVKTSEITPKERSNNNTTRCNGSPEISCQEIFPMSPISMEDVQSSQWPVTRKVDQQTVDSSLSKCHISPHLHLNKSRKSSPSLTKTLHNIHPHIRQTEIPSFLQMSKVQNLHSDSSPAQNPNFDIFNSHPLRIDHQNIDRSSFSRINVPSYLHFEPQYSQTNTHGDPLRHSHKSDINRKREPWTLDSPRRPVSSTEPEVFNSHSFQFGQKPDFYTSRHSIPNTPLTTTAFHAPNNINSHASGYFTPSAVSSGTQKYCQVSCEALKRLNSNYPRPFNSSHSFNTNIFPT